MRYLIILEECQYNDFEKVDGSLLEIYAIDKNGDKHLFDLRPIQREMVVMPNGASAYITQGHIDAMIAYEREQHIKELCDRMNHSLERTEVDYSKISKELEQVNRMDHDIRKNAEIIQEVYNRMVGRGATKEELDSFRNSIHKCDNLIQKYDALEKKDIPVIKKTCSTCKYCCIPRNCDAVVGMCTNFDKWEAKENENNK